MFLLMLMMNLASPPGINNECSFSMPDYIRKPEDASFNPAEGNLLERHDLLTQIT